MKKSCKTLVLAGFATFILCGVLQAEEHDREGAIRGIFIRLIEQRVGDQGYAGIVVKPHDRDDHVTVLIPRNREEIIGSARRLEEGAQMGISYVIEDGHRWIRDIEAEMRRERREERPKEEREVIIRREVRRESDRGEERPESRRRNVTRRGPEPERQRGREEREERQDRRPAAHLDHLQRQLREVVSGHLDRMSRSVREVLADHLWRMDAEFRELRSRVDRIERELEHLRAENERLRRELRERSSLRREHEREGREREEREIRIERDEY